MTDASAQPPGRAFHRLASRIGGHTLIYALSAGSTVVAGLVSVVAFTRYLEPTQFGELAVLYVSASFLTLLYNLASLQGTFSWVFGTAGDDDDAPDDATGPRTAKDSRRALMTGFVVTL